MMGARLLVTNAVASEPRLFLRSLFDVLMYEVRVEPSLRPAHRVAGAVRTLTANERCVQDFGDLPRSTSRLASTVLLNCERPAFASALLHNVLLSRARVVVSAQEAAHVIVQCLPLLAEYARCWRGARRATRMLTMCAPARADCTRRIRGCARLPW